PGRAAPHGQRAGPALVAAAGDQPAGTGAGNRRPDAAHRLRSPGRTGRRSLTACARIAGRAALAQLVEQPPCNSDAVVVVTGGKAKRSKALGAPARRLWVEPNTV